MAVAGLKQVRRLAVAVARLFLRLSGRKYYLYRDVTPEEEAENAW